MRTTTWQERSDWLVYATVGCYGRVVSELGVHTWAGKVSVNLKWHCAFTQGVLRTTSKMRRRRILLVYLLKSALTDQYTATFQKITTSSSNPRGVPLPFWWDLQTYTSFVHEIVFIPPFEAPFFETVCFSSFLLLLLPLMRGVGRSGGLGAGGVVWRWWCGWGWGAVLSWGIVVRPWWWA